MEEQKLYYLYKGIKRKDFPRWEGWNIIDNYKKNGIHVSLIEDNLLELFVENFRLLMYIKTLF